MQSILRIFSLFQKQTQRIAGFVSIQRIFLVVSILFLVGSTSAVVPEVAAQSGEGRWGKIRSIYTVEYNLASPRGMAFSPDANAFLLWDLYDNVTGISLREDPVDMAGLNIPVEDALDLAFENSSNSLFALNTENSELEKIDADVTGRPNPRSGTTTSYDLKAVGLQDAKGITFDPENGRLFVLNTKGTQIVVITPNSFYGYDGEAANQGKRVRRINLNKLHLGKLHGLAFNPQDGHLYSFQPVDQTLYEFTESGELVSSYDLSALELSSPQTLLFAPSGDNTDDPSNMNLFILDSGKTTLAQAQPDQADIARTGSAKGAMLLPARTTSTGGQIVELALNEPVIELNVALLPTTLVQVIDTSNAAWGDPPNPSSPDPAGVAYWPDHDSLLISDSEVEETNRYDGGPPPWFVGANIFESDLAGNLVDTCNTIDTPYWYSNEPAGITINPLNNHIFISDDTGVGHIIEVGPGDDTVYCNGDDTVTTLDFDGLDAEGVAVGDNTVFIAGGIDREVLKFDMGADGIMSGDDGPITSFDTNSLGIRDLEGIEYNPEAGTLFIASNYGSDHLIFEITVNGTLIETYDVEYLDFDYGGTTGGHIPRSGLAYGPSSQNPAIKNLYLSSRMVDNGSGDPVQALENDGKIFEIDIGNTTTGIRVIVDVAGDGTVNNTPGNPYTSGQTATLQPVPDYPGSTFSGWTGANAAELIDNENGTWDLPMDGYKFVTANFDSFIKTWPTSGLSNQPSSRTLYWYNSSGGSTYEYCYDTTNDNACSTSWVDVGTSTSVTLSGLSPDTTYYWQVRANNSAGTTYANGSETDYWSFTTGVSPGAFNKTWPTSGLTYQPTSLTLYWDNSSGGSTYEYCYDMIGDGTCSSWVDVGTSTSATLSGLSAGTTYYWQVRANNSFGTEYANGLDTDYWPFTTGVEPGVFDKTWPTSGLTYQPTNLTLYWSNSSGASSNEYCYDTLGDGTCSSWVDVGTSTSATLSGLSPGTTYFWQVRANNSFGTTYANSSATDYWSFTTGVEPGAFNKSWPTSGLTNQPSNPTLYWNTSSGSSSYEYCYDTLGDGTCSSWVSVGTSTSAALSGLSPGTTYFWQVRANNSFGTAYANGLATDYWSFTTGDVPGAFDKNWPASGLANQPSSRTLYWNKSSGSSSYEYCYDTTDDGACGSSWVSVGTSTSATLSGLSASTTYYWQVRANNGFGTVYANSSLTDYWSFTTGVKPGAFDKTWPLSGLANQPTNRNLYWSNSSGASSYEYCYDTLGDGTCSSWVDVGTSTSATLSGLSAGTTYYWQVRANNSFGTEYANGSVTDYWSFTTGTAPGAFNKTWPTSGLANQPTNRTLYWNKSSGASSYEYCYDTLGDGTCSSWVSVGTSTAVTLSGLSANTTYYWQVRSNNSFGTEYANGSDTDYWSFTTGSPPGAFNKTWPTSGLTDQPTNRTLYWNVSSGASSYEYCYDTLGDGTCSSWVSVGTSTAVTLSGLSEGTTYYWQVRVNNSFGTVYANGSATDYWSFTTGTAPGAFNKTWPTSGLADRPTNQTLYWNKSSGASSYEYCYDTLGDGTCSSWVSVGTSTAAALSGLASNTTYYWQVRANNSFGTEYANGSVTDYWSFTTAP